MVSMTYMGAVLSAICEEMRRDPRVFVMGEDIGTTAYASALREFGSERIRSTPISETGFVGAGIGAALTGMRPIVDATCATFLYSAMDQIVNQAAKARYMFGGQASVPIVIQASVMYKVAAAAHHSDRPWGLFAQVPGLKVIVPSCPYDAKGLVRAAIQDDNPVLCLHDVTLMKQRADVPDREYIIPIGVASIKRPGSDLTIISLAGSVAQSLEAAEVLESHGISAEVVDLRSVVPLDRDTIVASVERTGRLLVVDPAPRTCSVASEVITTACESAFEYLKAPVVRLTAPDIPVPFCPELERLMYPTVATIVAAGRKSCTAGL